MFSYGPSTQYKNKTNFFLTSYYRDILGCELEFLSWNYFESGHGAGHGKGAADAIGGTLKRLADNNVNKGTDIPDAVSLYSLLKSASKVCLFYVSDAEIKAVDQVIPSQLSPVRGTASIHQILSKGDGKLKLRKLSCFCTWPDPCCCYRTFETSFPPPLACKQDDTTGISSDMDVNTTPTTTSAEISDPPIENVECSVKKTISKPYPLVVITCTKLFIYVKFCIMNPNTPPDQSL